METKYQIGKLIKYKDGDTSTSIGEIEGINITKSGLSYIVNEKMVSEDSVINSYSIDFVGNKKKERKKRVPKVNVAIVSEKAIEEEPF